MVRQLPLFLKGNGYYTNWLHFATSMFVAVDLRLTVREGTSRSWRSWCHARAGMLAQALSGAMFVMTMKTWLEAMACAAWWGPRRPRPWCSQPSCLRQSSAFLVAQRTPLSVKQHRPKTLVPAPVAAGCPWMTGSAPVACHPANPDCFEAKAVSENSNGGVDSENKATVAADAGRDAEV